MVEVPTAMNEGPIEVAAFETITRLQPVGVTRLVEDVMTQTGADNLAVRAALWRLTAGGRVFLSTNLTYLTSEHDPLSRL